MEILSDFHTASFCGTQILTASYFKLRGQVIMNGGPFRPNQLQMAPENHGPMIRMGATNRVPFNPGATGPTLHTPPPRSPITPRPHQQRILPQKPLIVPLTCVEEELHIQNKQKHLYYGHAKDNVVISSDLCFIGCIFYFSEHLSKQSPKECEFKMRLAKWKANIVNYGGLVEDRVANFYRGN